MDKLQSIFNQQAKNPILMALRGGDSKVAKGEEGISQIGDDSSGAIEGENEFVQDMVLSSIGMSPEEMIATFQVDMNTADPTELAQSATEMISQVIGAAASGGASSLGTAKSIATSIATTLIPDARNLGAKYGSMSRIHPEGERESLGDRQLQLDVLSLDRHQIAMREGRRPSVTAKKCNSFGCGSYTFYADGYCVEHRNTEMNLLEEQLKRAMQLSKKDNDSQESLSNLEGSARNYFEDIKLEVEARNLESIYQVHHYAHTVDEARSSHGTVLTLVSAEEIHQLHHQFKCLDVDRDGIITLADLKALVCFVDPAMEEQSDDYVTAKCIEWFGELFNPSSWWSADPDQYQFNMNFTTYVDMVYQFRDEMQDKIYDASMHPFWSLRDCVVYCSRKGPKSGELFKRGNAFTKGSLNSFKSRYFELVRDSSSTDEVNRIRQYLSYYDSEGGTLKGQIDLRELAAIDFSSKTDDKVGVPIDGLTVFKLQTTNGRRYVLAAEKEKAMDWVSQLIPFTIGSRLIRDWCFHFGVVSRSVITLRDWMNAAMVLYKLERYKELSEEAKTKLVQLHNRERGARSKKERLVQKGASGAELAVANMQEIQARRNKREIIERLQEVSITDTDKFYLRLMNMTHEQLENTLKVIKDGMVAWNSMKDQLSAYDQQYTYGIIGSSAQAVGNAIQAYNYVRDAKNSFKAAKYNVNIVSKSSVSDCAICHKVFKMFTLKTEFSKHHCHACGRVVCHACSTQKLFFESTQSLERVCTECLMNGNAERQSKMSA